MVRGVVFGRWWDVCVHDSRFGLKRSVMRILFDFG